MIKRLENSSLQDHTFHGHYFETSKEDLEKVCGPVMYNDDDSDEVTQNEWEMTTEDGTTFTIYDYKEFRSYEDYEKHNKKFVPSWNLKHLLGPFEHGEKKIKIKK